MGSLETRVSLESLTKGFESIKWRSKANTGQSPNTVQARRGRVVAERDSKSRVRTLYWRRLGIERRVVFLPPNSTIVEYLEVSFLFFSTSLLRYIFGKRVGKIVLRREPSGISSLCGRELLFRSQTRECTGSFQTRSVCGVGAHGAGSDDAREAERRQGAHHRRRHREFHRRRRHLQGPHQGHSHLQGRHPPRQRPFRRKPTVVSSWDPTPTLLRRPRVELEKLRDSVSLSREYAKVNLENNGIPKGSRFLSRSKESVLSEKELRKR